MAKYAYPAVFTPEKNGFYSIVFPDLEGCYTCGDSIKDGIEHGDAEKTIEDFSKAIDYFTRMG